MLIDLKGKTALVTGSTEGIGYAVARQLARAGADVVVNGRSEDKTEKAAGRLRSEGAKGIVTGVAADLATAEGCAKLVVKVPLVDILVNNAGIFQPSDFFDTTDEVWDRHWQVNVMSAVRLSRAYLPGMQEAKLGPRRLHRIGIRLQHSGGNDPLRRQQDGRHRCRARACQTNGRHWSYRKLGSPWSNSFRRRRSNACR